MATATAPQRLPGATRRKELDPGCEHGGNECSQSGGEGLALGEKLSGAWEGLLAAGLAECPVCGGEMEFVAGAGQCAHCGSVLS